MCTRTVWFNAPFSSIVCYLLRVVLREEYDEIDIIINLCDRGDRLQIFHDADGVDDGRLETLFSTVVLGGCGHSKFPIPRHYFKSWERH